MGGTLVALWGAASSLPGPVVAVLALACTSLVLSIRERLPSNLQPHTFRGRSFPDSVLEAIDRQRDNLIPSLVLTQHGWDHTEIQNQSYIDFEFHFVNASVFNVFLNGQPSGHIRWSDNILESIPELEHPRLDGHNVGPLVQAGSGFVIRLRQFLRDWAAQRIYMAQDAAFSFSFDDVRIYVGSSNDTTDQRPSIPLGTYTFNWRKPEPNTAGSPTQ